MPGWTPPPPGPTAWSSLGTYQVVSAPEGPAGWWEPADVDPAVRAHVAEWAATVATEPFVGARLRDSGSACLRVRVRLVPADRVEAIDRQLAADFDFGPMGAPPDYPRVPVEELFRFAASHAND